MSLYIIYNFKGAPSADDIPLLPVEEPDKKGKAEKDIPGFFDRVDSTDTVTEPPPDDYLVLEHQTPYNQLEKLQIVTQSSHKQLLSD